MNIIWLASYPKSGNTWMRVFLTNYLRNADTPADINDLEFMGMASNRDLFDTYAGIESSDLTHEEIYAARPAVYRLLAQDSSDSPELRFIKVHDAYTRLPDGCPLFPADATKGAIYIIRNPLDVAVSRRAHFNETLDQAVAGMANPKARFAATQRALRTQLRYTLGAWSSHVCSWLDSPTGFPVHVVRYEDMSQHPYDTFAQVLAFVGLPIQPVRLEQALRFSQFDTLQRQETAHGFRERPQPMARFFRSGKIGSWQEQLTAAQLAQIIADHGTVMRRFGYLSDSCLLPQPEGGNPHTG